MVNVPHPVDGVITNPVSLAAAIAVARDALQQSTKKLFTNPLLPGTDYDMI